MAHPYWPLYDLEVRTPRLTLRYIDEELSVELARLAATGVHDPAFMPFTIAWTDLPSPQLERGAMQFHWRTRAETAPASWRIGFATIVDGTVVGSTDLSATGFPALRQFETGSWLGREYQGQGIGKEMRLASLTLGFDGLGAMFATTAAWTDNAQSLGVTRSLGYAETGPVRGLRRGEAGEQMHFRMSAEHFAAIRRTDIEITGIDPVREFLDIQS
jgi:RimJ/RimL family protein N-acetyltransferase